jgi:hypothetical protein
VASKLMTYGLGRGLERYDRPLLKQIVRRVAGEDYRFSSLVLAIVSSPAFQMRRVEPPAPPREGDLRTAHHPTRPGTRSGRPPTDEQRTVRPVPALEPR